MKPISTEDKLKELIEEEIIFLDQLTFNDSLKAEEMNMVIQRIQELEKMKEKK